MRTQRKPTLPGQILKELYLRERRITMRAFAQAVGCSPKHISHLVNGKARIEAEMATRIAAVLGTSPQLWLNLQNTFDLWEVRERIRDWRPAAVFPAILQPAGIG